MKQYQIIIRNTNTKDNGNILHKGNLWSLTMKDLPDDAGYATLGAAKRIATLINKDPKSAGLVGMLDIEAQAMSVEEITKLAVDQGKSLTRDLMERYYPEQEKRIQDEAERAKAEAAVGGRLTNEEWAEVKAANAKAQPKPVKAKRVRKPRPLKSPLDLTEKQVFFLDNMRKDSFYERGLDSALFVDVLADTLEGLGMGKMTTGAMVSTLREKGLIVTGKDSRGAGKFTTMVLTDLGKEVMRKYNLA